MFIIADIHHKVPSYFWKLSNNTPLISMDIKNAKMFNSFTEAKTFLNSMKSEAFVFNVVELGIVKIY